MFPPGTLEVNYTVRTLSIPHRQGKKHTDVGGHRESTLQFPSLPILLFLDSLQLWPNPKVSKHKKQHDHPRSAGKYSLKQASSIKHVIASNKQKRSLQAGPWGHGHLVKLGREIWHREEQRMLCLSSYIHQLGVCRN